MNRSHVSKALALTLSLELIVAPIIPAVQAETTSRPASSQVNGTANTINKTLQVVETVMRGVQPQGSQMSGQMAMDMQALAQQQTPQPDKYFNLQKLGQIPELGNYLALNGINPNSLNCATLPTTLHDARPEVCRLGITGDSGVNQQAQLGQMFGYYDQYFKIEKLYKNYSATSNGEGQGFGVGCMRNAMNILNGFFKYRLDELDKLTTNMEKLQNDFREASRADLDAIEEAVAVLDGQSAIADKVRSKNPDLFDFGKRFGDPACKSMLSDEQFNERGREGGLNFINTDLKRTLTTKNGRFSGESYAQSHNAVVQDISNLADKVAQQFTLNFEGLSRDAQGYGRFLSELPNSVSSTQGLNRAISPDLFADVQTKFNEDFIKLNDRRTTVLNELRAGGVPGDAAANLLGNLNSSNFNNEVRTIENNLKNKCFQDSVSRFNKDLLMSKIYDPNASNHANKNASNFFKDRLDQIISNRETSLEKKLSELTSLENQTQSRYFMKIENKYTVQEVDRNGNITKRLVNPSNRNGDITERVVNPSSRSTPAVFFSDLIKSCNAQFEVNKLNNQLSGKQAIQKLRDLNTDYKKLAKSQAKDLKNELRRRMIECNTPEEANSSIPGSCDPSRFDTSSPGFCAKAALSCSKNMQACTQKVDKFVKEIRAQKTARVNNYKALVQKNKQDIVKLFDSALARYMQQGEAMRGIFGAGFSSPAGISREVPENQRYLTEFQQATGRPQDGTLLLEDPDKYVEMFKRNIATLKDSVRKQQDQILGGESVGNNTGLLAAHIQQTERNYDLVAKDASNRARECITNHDRAIQAADAARQEQMKRQQELGERQQEYCARFNMAANGNPNPACSSPVEDAFSFGSNGELERFCNQTQNSSDGNSNKTSRALGICYREGHLNADAATGNQTESEPVQTARSEVDDADRALNRAQTRLARADQDVQRGSTDAREAELTAARAAVDAAQTTLDEKNAALNDALRAERTASQPSSPTPATGNLIGRNCQQLNNCGRDEVRSEEGSDRQTTSSCRDELMEALADTIINASGEQPVLTADMAPAFCQAAFNSNDRFADILNQIERGLATPSGGASGM